MCLTQDLLSIMSLVLIIMCINPRITYKMWTGEVNYRSKQVERTTQIHKALTYTSIFTFKCNPNIICKMYSIVNIQRLCFSKMWIILTHCSAFLVLNQKRHHCELNRFIIVLLLWLIVTDRV